MLQTYKQTALSTYFEIKRFQSNNNQIGNIYTPSPRYQRNNFLQMKKNYHKIFDSNTYHCTKFIEVSLNYQDIFDNLIKYFFWVIYAYTI